MGTRLLAFAVMLLVAVMSGGNSTGEEEENSSPVQQGFEISPIPKSLLNLTGKDYAGSGGAVISSIGREDCSAFNSFPLFLEKGLPPAATRRPVIHSINT